MSNDAPKKKRLSKKQKEEINSVIEEALIKADVIDVSANKDYILVVRVGTDVHPANIEQLRIVNSYINKMKKDGYISEHLTVVTVAHNVEFTREALTDIEWLTDESGDSVD